MQACLVATRFIDSAHPAVVAFALEAVAGVAGERARAIAVFRAVRDRIKYDPYSVDLSAEAMTASATLARGRGFCIPKAVLLAACLRALGIPARLGFADVTNHLATPRLLQQLRTDLFVYHGFVDAFVEGRWVKATPAFDAPLCAWFKVPPLDWDGTTDAVLQPFDGAGRRFMEYLRDRGVSEDLPLDDIVRVMHEVYPHLFDAKGTPLPFENGATILRKDPDPV